jgi:hypothetical protein
MTNEEESIQALEEAWVQPGGFLFDLTEGKYDPVRGEEFMASLLRIKCPEGKTITRKLVKVLWQIPDYLNDRRADVLDSGGDIVAFDQFHLMIAVIVEDLLGGPPLDRGTIATLDENLEE